MTAKRIESARLRHTSETAQDASADTVKETVARHTMQAPAARPQEGSLAVEVVQTPVPRSLPLSPTPLIGREQEVETARAVLLRPDCRLLTLLGTGGIGKTRLALAVAEEVADQFRDRVCFLDLARITQAAEFPSLLATQLGVPVDDGTALRRVMTYLKPHQLLLVLDNCEHVLLIGPVVSALLAACPRLSILATSREPLGLRWEQRMVVGPLALPDLHQLPPTEALRQVPAVALFLQRARALNLRYQVDDATVQQIAAVCRRLEGIPLAIELAAARTPILSPAAMLQRMEAGFALLQEQAPDVPSRHHSLQASLDWSYDLLSAEEQAGFRRLGVFVGGFSLAAAEALLGGDPPPSDALATLSSLADHGLIQVEMPPGREPRFHLLDTLRSYALEQLEQAREYEASARAHACFYVALAERALRRIRMSGGGIISSPRDAAPALDPTPSSWLVVLDREYANIGAALTRTEHHDRPTFVRLAMALAPYWSTRGLLQEGTVALEGAVTALAEDELAVRSRALGGLGLLYHQQGDVERAHAVLEEAVALAREAGDQPLLISLLIDWGSVRLSQRRPVEAARSFQEAVELAEDARDAWALAVALAHQGALALLDRHAHRAELHYRTSLALVRDLGDQRSAITAALHLARCLGMHGAKQQALPVLAEALQWCRELGQETVIPMALEVTARIVAADGPDAVCAQLLGAGETLRAHGHARTATEATIHTEALAAVTRRLDAKRLAAAVDQGMRWSPHEALDQAIRLVETVRSCDALRTTTRPQHGIGPPLSARELDVLSLLAAGRSNKEIGDRLGITEHTAKYHATSIYNKLGVNGRAEAVVAALRWGLLDP